MIRPKTPRPKVKRDFNRKFRKAFFSVVDNYNEIRESVGQAQAIDYAATQEGKPMYKNDLSFLKIIDYSADVHNTLKATLNPQEMGLFKKHYLGQPNQSANSTKEMLNLQEKAGKEFIKRGLYPIVKYFGGLK